MKKILVSLAVAMLLLFVLASIAYAATGVSDPLVLQQLAQLRRATAKYHDINAALADGFILPPGSECVLHPEQGGMGIHYIHPARMMDTEVNILEPEILLYAESANGLKLIGVEYWFSLGPPDTELKDLPQPLPPCTCNFWQIPGGSHGST